MKKFKVLGAGLMAGIMLLSVAGCANFKATDKKTFENALEDVLDLEEDEDYWVVDDDYNWIDDSDTYIYGYDGNCYYAFIEFDDAKDAADYFDDYYYDDFEDMIKDKDFDGKYKMSFDGKETGYITFSGEADSKDFYDDDIYGGVYCKDGIVVIAYATSDKKSDIEDIDAFLKAIGYPKP